MSNRFISGTGLLGIALGLIALSAVPATGQVTGNAAKSDPPRTPDGHPDLQGVYDLATMTPLERWPGDPPFLTKEQAEGLQRGTRPQGQKPQRRRAPTARSPPAAGGRHYERTKVVF